MSSLVGRSTAGQRTPRPPRSRSLLRAGAGFFLLVELVALGCGPSRAAPPQEAHAAARAAEPVVRDLDAPISGGAETCFNATDDNGNLLIDEGCDVRQGDVHFMIAWSEPTVDVDLLVVDPAGSVAGTGGPSTLGLVLSDDCPRAGGACAGQAFESVHLDDEEVPGGTFHVRVVVQGGPGARLARPLSVRFGARLPGISVAKEIEFTNSAREVSLSFSTPAPKKVDPVRE